MEALFSNLGFDHISDKIVKYLTQRSLSNLSKTSKSLVASSSRFWFPKFISRKTIDSKTSEIWNYLISCSIDFPTIRTSLGRILRLRFTNQFQNKLEFCPKFSDNCPLILSIIYEETNLLKFILSRNEIQLLIKDRHVYLKDLGLTQIGIHKSPLDVAVSIGNVGMVKILMPFSDDFEHAFELAVQRDEPEIMKLLHPYCKSDMFKRKTLERIEFVTKLGNVIALNMLKELGEVPTYLDYLSETDSILWNSIHERQNIEYSNVQSPTSEDSSTPDEFGNTIVHDLVEKCEVDELKNILPIIREPNAQNNFNISPLHIALRKYSKMIRIGNETKAEKFREIIELILSTFHNLQCQDFDGNTALHIAVEDNLIEIVKKLVPFYQNLEIENKLGYTPYMSAKFHKHFAIIDFLNVELKKRVDLE